MTDPWPPRDRDGLIEETIRNGDAAITLRSREIRHYGSLARAGFRVLLAMYFIVLLPAMVICIAAGTLAALAAWLAAGRSETACVLWFWVVTAPLDASTWLADRGRAGGGPGW